MVENAMVPTQTTIKDPRTKSDKVNLWLERVNIAKKSLEDWARKEGADRFIQEYNGKFEIFFNGLKGQIPVPPINLIFAYVDADISNTYNRDPYISVNPKSGTVLGAKLWEAIINYKWRHLRTKNEVETEIIDKDLVGFAFHKVGYEVETSGAEEDLKIIHESLISKRIDWKDIVWNFGAKNPPYDCLWMAHRIVKPLEYIKQKYPTAKNLQGTPNPEIDKQAYDRAIYKDDISVGVIWEIWNKMDRMIYLVADGLNGQYLEDPRPWPEYMEEFPFLMYWDYYAPGKQRPLSAIAPWEPQILEFMVLLAAAINHHKRWSRQLLIKKGAISDGDLDKIERGNDGAIVDYTGTGDLNQNIFKLDWGTMPTDYYMLMDRLSDIMRQINGQPEFERGGITRTQSRTEGELQLIANGAKGRNDRRVDRFETHLENIARHMLMHLKANFDFEETIKITGDTPEEVIEALGESFDPITKTIKFSNEDIEGEYDVEIKAGSTLPLNRETKVSILRSVLQTLGNVGEAGVSPMLRTIVEEILSEYDMKSLKLAYQLEEQQNDQATQMQQQKVNALDIKAKTQAAKNVAQADKIGAEADKIKMQNVLDQNLQQFDQVAQEGEQYVGM
jgi:hypothetical protein